MKPHSEGFKEQITQMGRQLRGLITYGNTILEEEIRAITPHYEANLLKSVMKQLDLELSVDIPLETVINCQIGIMVNDNYEMLNYGNYVVYSSEKQEDTDTYKIVCYDKMLYAMKQNEDLGVEYPISIKAYLTALATKIGLSVANATFNNENLQIPSELYVGQEYTYRDILDEIAQATGSIICINNNDNIEVRYPTETNDTIDEEFLKDVNVDFAEKYGPINSIVLSRSAESDNVYLQDYESVQENGLCEIKIVDNQIMNFNNRSDFLQGILDALDGLYYYINDFNSTGILYYEVADLYNITVKEKNYQCLMLNDEVNATTGIEEIIHTDMPEQGETDYEKADKTDRRINQTYLIVDKQNQRIDSVVSNVSEQNNKISQITQTVDEINSKIQDIADITTYGESDAAYVELTDINQSEPIMIKVHPTAVNIGYLYPRNNLYPSNSLYMTTRIIRFVRTYEEEGITKTENIDYELPDDLLRYSSEIYDEFYLDYDSQTCQIIKRCEYFGGGGTNLFNPQYFEGTTSAISSKTVTQDEEYIIRSSYFDGPGTISNSIELENNFYINSSTYKRFLYFTDLKNITGSDIQIDVKCYNTNNELIQTFSGIGAVSIERGSNLPINTYYYKLTFNFLRRTASQQYSFRIMMNTGTESKPYETYNLVIKRLAQEQTTDYPYPEILLNDGDYEISLLGYDYGYLYVRLMAQNIYTTQFATKAEVTSEINQKANEIDISVNQKLDSYPTKTEMNSAITVSANEINSTVSRKVGKDEIISSINQSSEAVSINAGKINLNGAVTANQNFKIKTDGSMEAKNATFSGTVNATGGKIAAFTINTDELTSKDGNGPYISLSKQSIHFGKRQGSSDYSLGSIGIFDNNSYITFLRADGNRSEVVANEMTAETYNRLSLESLKTNIEQYKDNAVELIKNNDIYEYNFKTEKDKSKKHLGFIIPDNGGNYKTPDEVIAQSGEGIDTYSMTSILWKAVQEQQEQIEQMKKEIETLKGGNK